MERCPLCPNKHKCISPDGPTSSPYLLIGEAPGWDEERNGKVFVGKTGREVNEGYLPLAGLRRESVRIANAIRCLPDTPQNKLDLGKEKHRLLLESCSQYLLEEMETGDYGVIIPMGALANHVVDPDIDLELMHGIPQQTAWGSAFPMFHPAGGLHEPKKMLHIRTDWTRLRKYLTGKLRVPVDEFSGLEDYLILQTCEELDDLMAPCNDYTMACDTEVTRKGKFFCLTFSLWPGMGRMILADQVEILQRFQYWLNRWSGLILWHNWPFDALVVQQIPLVFPVRKVRDTMAIAFHLGNLPQGLKALAYRELGMRMMDFDDLVTPYSVPKVLAYYEQIRDKEWPKPDGELVRDDRGKWKTYSPQGMNTKIKRFFTDYKKNPKKNVFDAWDNWESSQGMIEEDLGPWPGKCITHAWAENPEAVIRYACRDTDADLRLYEIEKGMRRMVRKRSQEHWRDFATA